MRQGTSRDDMSSFSVDHLLCMQPTHKSPCFPSQTPLERTKCSFASLYKLGIASGLGTGILAHFNFHL